MRSARRPREQGIVALVGCAQGTHPEPLDLRGHLRREGVAGETDVGRQAVAEEAELEQPVQLGAVGVRQHRTAEVDAFDDVPVSRL